MHSVTFIDNYDSFTYSLVDLLRRCGAAVSVHKNDEIDVEHVLDGAPDAILIGPGPGRPEDAGITLPLISALVARGPAAPKLLGVCLGHQAVAQHFGARLTYAPVARHGKRASIQHNGRGLFEGVSSPTQVACYNSLTVAPESLPPSLKLLARCSIGEVMALRTLSLPIHTIQFHPESILSENGTTLIGNWLAAS